MKEVPTSSSTIPLRLARAALYLLVPGPAGGDHLVTTPFRLRVLRSAALMVVGAGLAALVAGCGGAPAESPLSTDEACELLVDHALRSTFGAWKARYHYVVWCNRSNPPNEIVVTITPANGQEDMRQDPELMKKQAEAAIDTLLTQKHWQERYSRVRLQFVP